MCPGMGTKPLLENMKHLIHIEPKPQEGIEVTEGERVGGKNSTV